MNIIILGLVALTIALFLTVLILLKRLKQTKASLQELLRESEISSETPKVKEGDIYFKIDNQFNLTLIDPAGAKNLGFEASALIGKPVLGNLIDDCSATKEFLDETFAKIAKRQTTFNTQILIKRADGKNMLVLARIRPTLNEILKCSGLSFLCKDISQTDKLENELIDLKSLNPFTNILNQSTLEKKFAHDFKLATRYNKELAAIIVELKDIYDFIAKGIDFETADKMIKDISLICAESLPENGYAGHIDKTKIVIVMKDATRQQALEYSGMLLNKSVNAIKALRVDEANAQMIVISYSNRKGFTDSFDGMTSRLYRHINTALKQKEYGIISSDCRQTTLVNLENIKG